jgi:hypothetical protein
VPAAGTNVRRALTTPELRRTKLTRDDFLVGPRRPITVVLDGVKQNSSRLILRQRELSGLRKRLRRNGHPGEVGGEAPALVAG